MKKSWLYGCSFILLSIFATACGDDEKDIYGIFYADIVTCHTNKGNPYFTYQTTDSAPVDTLYPVSEVNSDDMGEGVRVLLQYRPIETLSEHKKQVEIQALSAIHFDTLRIVPHDKIDQLPDDTLYLQSAWKTGDFLNLRYRIDYQPAAQHPACRRRSRAFRRYLESTVATQSQRRPRGTLEQSILVVQYLGLSKPSLYDAATLCKSSKFQL